VTGALESAATPSASATIDDATAIDAPSTPASPANVEIAQQVSSALLSLRGRADGSYRMRLELKPPELGRVELHVELRDGVLSVHMRAEQAHAAEVLHQELGRLREQLANEGVQTGELTVDGRAAHNDSGAPQRDTSTAAHDGEHDGGAPDRASADAQRRAPHHSPATSPSRIDLQV
jgi:flagellar hook-length control protein FliK